MGQANGPCFLFAPVLYALVSAFVCLSRRRYPIALLEPEAFRSERWGEHQTMRANGVDFHCVVKGNGPLMLLLHGFPEVGFYYYPHHDYHIITIIIEREKNRGIGVKVKQITMKSKNKIK